MATTKSGPEGSQLGRPPMSRNIVATWSCQSKDQYTAKPPFVPTQVGITSAPKELRVSMPMFPKPHPIEFGVGNAREKIWVFSHRAVVFIPMAVNVSAQPGEAPLTVKLSYQACDDKQCLLPTSVEHQVRLPIVVTTAGVKPLAEELFAALKDYGNQVRVSFFGWNFSFAAMIAARVSGVAAFALQCASALGKFLHRVLGPEFHKFSSDWRTDGVIGRPACG